MDEQDIRKRLLAQFGIRIEPEMSRYVLQRLSNNATSIPVMGGNARTGIAMRTAIDAQALIDGDAPKPSA